MKLNKFEISSLALAGMTLVSGLAAVPAMAATDSGVSMAATHIQLDGKTVFSPKHVIAKDPMSGVETTWVPIYYLQQTLKKVGFQTSWNGKVLTFDSYPQGWVTQAALGNLEAGPAGKSDMQIQLVKNANPSENVPKLVARDPASGVETTYAPIYYINQILNYYWVMHAFWNGQDDVWSMYTQQNSPITEKPYTTSTGAANAVQTIKGDYTYFKLNSAPVDLGLGITANTGSRFGQVGYRWQEGNWTVDVFVNDSKDATKNEQVAKSVVSYLHTHMMPAPDNQGVIAVNDTGVTADTTIVWQEGTKVYTLERPGSPVNALQAVVNSK